jgi:hypothetical protein
MSKPLGKSYTWNGKEWKDYSGNLVSVVPIQEEKQRMIPTPIAEEAYKEYAEQYGKEQTFARLCERGGFGFTEMIILLYQRCCRLEPCNAVCRTAHICEHGREYLPAVVSRDEPHKRGDL